MSALRELNNKENATAESAARHKTADASKLERLYSEQLQRAQEAHHELERLEMELLARDKLLLESQNAMTRASETNRRLVEKFQADMEFLEQEAELYKSRATALMKELEVQRAECEKLRREVGFKDDEMASLNQELDEVLLELENRCSQDKSEGIRYKDDSDDSSEGMSFLTPSSRRELSESGDEDDFNTHEILIDDDLDELTDDENEGEVGMDSMSLTTELNMKLEQKDAELKMLQFEMKSLKNEKSQLYTYVNKLLKNKPSADQNDILKEKLVRRKILRAVSINTVKNALATEGTAVPNTATNSSRYRSKRIMSNYVNLKSYKIDNSLQRSSKHDTLDLSNNSDEEDDEINKELEMERLMLGYKVVGSIFKLPLVTPLHDILKSVIQTEDDVDLTVD